MDKLLEIELKKVIKGLESQLDDLSKYADADEVLTLTQDQAKDILNLLKRLELAETVKPLIVPRWLYLRKLLASDSKTQ